MEIKMRNTSILAIAAFNNTIDGCKDFISFIDSQIDERSKKHKTFVSFSVPKVESLKELTGNGDALHLLCDYYDHLGYTTNLSSDYNNLTIYWNKPKAETVPF